MSTFTGAIQSVIWRNKNYPRRSVRKAVGIKVNGRPINSLKFTDKGESIAECLNDLQWLIDQIVEMNDIKIPNLNILEQPSPTEQWICERDCTVWMAYRLISVFQKAQDIASHSLRSNYSSNYWSSTSVYCARSLSIFSITFRLHYLSLLRVPTIVSLNFLCTQCLSYLLWSCNIFISLILKWYSKHFRSLVWIILFR